MNLYIQIRKNQITVRHLGTQLEASTLSAFSNNRILVADSMAASKALRSVIRQVTLFDWCNWFRSTTLLIHARGAFSCRGTHTSGDHRDELS